MGLHPAVVKLVAISKKDVAELIDQIESHIHSGTIADNAVFSFGLGSPKHHGNGVVRVEEFNRAICWEHGMRYNLG